jgi:hypothetical protein
MNKKETYLGEASVKCLDKGCEKYGAFIEFDFDELTDFMLMATLTKSKHISTLKVKVLPNKANDGYTCKVITEEYE